jgi:Fe-S-cluster-containing hydrogenase component 2
VVCPTAALQQLDSEGSGQLSFDAAECIACGECVASCPEIAAGEIKFELGADLGALSAGSVAINHDDSVLCRNCDRAFTSAKTVDRLEQLLGDTFSYDH